MSEQQLQPPERPLRVWPGIVIVALQWLAVVGTGWIAPATPVQFFGMLGGPLVGSLLMLLWWLFASRASWSERLTTAALIIVAAIATIMLADQTTKMAVFVFGIPAIWTAFVAVATLGRGWTRRARRVPVVAAVLLVCVGYLLVRSEGVDGDMSGSYAWRWSATSEQKFLASAPQTGTATAPPAGDTAMPAVAEWPGFRGAGREGIVRGVRIDTNWDASPPEELWKHPVGPGWSSFAIAGGRLYTQEQRGEEEAVICYHASTGEPLWVHADQARFWEGMAGAGPRATPTYHEGRIYTFGATGILNCLEADTGNVVWSRDSAADTGASTPDWGFASSPLVVDGLVVVYTGAPSGKAVVAYDTDSGEPRWYAAAGALSYSSAHAARIDGQRQLVVLTGDGATSLGPDNGEVLWQHDWPAGGGARVVQPAVLEDGSVLIGTGFGLGLRRVSASLAGGAWSVDESWTSTALKPYFNDFVVHRDHAYGFDGRILSCVDLASGERVWKGGRYGNGQVLLLADQDLLLVLSDRGEVALVEAQPSGFTEVARFEAIEGKTWNHPAIADGVLYVRNGEEMAAFRIAPVNAAEAATPACDEPAADPWVGELRDRVLQFDQMARFAAERFGAPEDCRGKVTTEFDGMKFGVVTLAYPGGASLEVETMPPEASLVGMRAPSGFADEDAARRLLQDYVKRVGVEIDWTGPTSTTTRDGETTESFESDESGMNVSAALVFVDGTLHEIRFSMAL